MKIFYIVLSVDYDDDYDEVVVLLMGKQHHMKGALIDSPPNSIHYFYFHLNCIVNTYKNVFIVLYVYLIRSTLVLVKFLFVLMVFVWWKNMLCCVEIKCENIFRLDGQWVNILTCCFYYFFLFSFVLGWERAVEFSWCDDLWQDGGNVLMCRSFSMIFFCSFYIFFI